MRWGRGFEDGWSAGPQSWRHRHLFGHRNWRHADSNHVDYELPLGLPDVVAPGGASIARKFGLRAAVRDDLDFHARHRGAEGDRHCPAPPGWWDGSWWRYWAAAAMMCDAWCVESHWGQGHSLVSGRFGMDFDPEALLTSSTSSCTSRGADRKRFTAHHKARVFDSESAPPTCCARPCDLSSDVGERALVVASAAGYYGADRGDEVLTGCQSARR